MALYLIKPEDARLHVSKGNRKIGTGIWALSTLPGNQDHLLHIKGKGLLTTIPGTCSKYCDGCAKDGACYAWRDAKLHHNAVIKAWGENTLLLRENIDKFFEDINVFISAMNAKYKLTKNPDHRRVKVWRWHVSGEIESLQQLEKMNEVALKHPEVIFSVYTKNYDVLREFLTKNPNGDFAPNFVVNVSQWHHVADDFLAEYPDKFNVFEYDDSHLKTCEMSEEDKARLAKMKHCPSVGKDGKRRKKADGTLWTCSDCLFCYEKHPGEHIAVHAH